MTVSTTGSGGVAEYDEDAMLGFEDMDQSDLVIPRISIDHKTGVYVDSLSGQEFPSLNVILLGVVKQRIMWKKETEDGDVPLCKSPDHENGFPTLSDEIPASKRFPWASSGLSVNDFPASAGVNGLVTLPCGSCMHKEWKSPLAGGQAKPMCDEQFTFPLMFTPDDENWQMALLTVQKTGIKPSKAYISSYATGKIPMFKFHTQLGLLENSRGTVTYCTPTYKRTVETDRNMWAQYAEALRNARDFVRMPPENYDEVPEEGDNTNGPAPSAAPVRVAATPVATVAAPVRTAPVQPVVAAPVAAPIVADPEPDDDEDLPF